MLILKIVEPVPEQAQRPGASWGGLCKEEAQGHRVSGLIPSHRSVSGVEWHPRRDGVTMNLTFWTQEWPLIRDAPHLAIGGAIVIALAVWALVSWAYRRKIALLKAESGAWEARFVFAHDREAVVSQKKRNELEAAVQLLSNQTTANATTKEIAATTQRVTLLARELASANSALSKALS